MLKSCEINSCTFPGISMPWGLSADPECRFCGHYRWDFEILDFGFGSEGEEYFDQKFCLRQGILEYFFHFGLRIWFGIFFPLNFCVREVGILWRFEVGFNRSWVGKGFDFIMLIELPKVTVCGGWMDFQRSNSLVSKVKWIMKVMPNTTDLSLFYSITCHSIIMSWKYQFFSIHKNSFETVSQISFVRHIFFSNQLMNKFYFSL